MRFYSKRRRKSSLAQTLNETVGTVAFTWFSSIGSSPSLHHVIGTRESSELKTPADVCNAFVLFRSAYLLFFIFDPIFDGSTLSMGVVPPPEVSQSHEKHRKCTFQNASPPSRNTSTQLKKTTTKSYICLMKKSGKGFGIYLQFFQFWSDF